MGREIKVLLYLVTKSEGGSSKLWDSDPQAQHLLLSSIRKA